MSFSKKSKFYKNKFSDKIWDDSSSEDDNSIDSSSSSAFDSDSSCDNDNTGTTGATGSNGTTGATGVTGPPGINAGNVGFIIPHDLNAVASFNLTANVPTTVFSGMGFGTSGTTSILDSLEDINTETVPFYRMPRNSILQNLRFFITNTSQIMIGPNNGGTIQYQILVMTSPSTIDSPIAMIAPPIFTSTTLTVSVEVPIPAGSGGIPTFVGFSNSNLVDTISLNSGDYVAVVFMITLTSTIDIEIQINSTVGVGIEMI